MFTMEQLETDSVPVVALTGRIITGHSTSGFAWMAAAVAALTYFNHTILHEQF